jgi:hypothetical protein
MSAGLRAVVTDCVEGSGRSSPTEFRTPDGSPPRGARVERDEVQRMQTKVLVPIVAGAVLFLLGIALGNWIAGSPATALAASAESAAEMETASALRALEDHLRILTDEVRALRADSARRPTHLATDLDSLSIAARESNARRGPLPEAADGASAGPNDGASEEASDESSREPLGDSGRALDAILARLETLEATQRALLAAGSLGPAKLELQIPPGMAVRDFLQALKNCGYEEDVKRAHLLWDAQRVRSVYGAPDEEHDRGDYVEWIYKLREEGTQFDFHFVNGLAVEAH